MYVWLMVTIGVSGAIEMSCYTYTYVINAINKQKNGKSAGPDGINNEACIWWA